MTWSRSQLWAEHDAAHERRLRRGIATLVVVLVLLVDHARVPTSRRPAPVVAPAPTAAEVASCRSDADCTEVRWCGFALPTVCRLGHCVVETWPVESGLASTVHFRTP